VNAPRAPAGGARWLKLVGVAVAIVVLFAFALGSWAYSKLRGSLPQLDGTAAVPGLRGQVTVERDALGVPTIHAINAVEAARALGFLHAQDRFFQMDLTRRRAAGELSEIFGKATLELDRRTRRHNFRALAQEVLRRETPEEQRLLEAYADGVNAGLAALQTKPFEYVVLRVKPAAWRPEDCVLILYAMTLTLQDDDGRYKHSLATLWDILGPRAFAFLAPTTGPDDAALDGSQAPLAPVPPAGVMAVHAPAPVADGASARTLFAAGSNSLAVSGAHTAQGGAVLANDMHLDLAVPNAWYRAELVWGSHRVTGVTLPGAPFVVAGSNGHIAWGFTSSYTDTGDLIILTQDSPRLYRGPKNEILEIEKRTSEIAVKGSQPVTATYDWTVWGPIVGTDPDKRPLVYHWTADDPAATAIDFLPLATAATADEALAAAHQLGIPNENFLVADEAGRIGWTIAGQLPKRVGYDGRLPVFWQYGDRSWAGYLAGPEVPTVAAGDFLWTANQRMLGGEGFTRLGDGGPYLPGRAAQIRDNLQELIRLKPATVAPADLLAIELDDRARFLERWQQLALRVLTPAAIASHPERAAFRAAVETWGGRATPESASYRLVRAFRLHAADLALGPIFAPCVAADPGFDWSRFQFEGPLWALLQEKPAYLLNPQYATWDQLLIGAVDATTEELKAEGTSVAQATWGAHNTLSMVHPFSHLLPRALVSWLNMPPEALPGGDDMPRIQGPSFGASERFAVIPGREREGIFEMPGGQSGHPLSPYYRAGHEAWVHGDPAPFLPGATEHTLTLSAP
jgi:penicillin amidase